jgi:hypothetical protein
MKNKLTQGFHKHHIVPKHAGGTDDKSNIVLLHPIDHAIWHLVRYKMFKNKKDLSSAHAIQSHLTQDEIFSVDTRGINNPMFGKKRPDVVKRNLENNPMLGKIGENCPNYKGPILATNIKTNEQLILKGFKEIIDAGFTQSCVSLCINGKRKTHKGFTFKRI